LGMQILDGKSWTPTEAGEDGRVSILRRSESESKQCEKPTPIPNPIAQGFKGFPTGERYKARIYSGLSRSGFFFSRTPRINSRALSFSAGIRIRNGR
jgi:hypothetical protein